MVLEKPQPRSNFKDMNMLHIMLRNVCETILGI